MRARCHCLALFAIAILAGCSAESELTRLDSGFSAADLRQGKVAVLGVVKFQEPDQIRPPLIAMMEKTWREERADVPLVSADSVRARLGAERDRKLLLGYEYQGKLDGQAIAEIADSLRGVARYVMVGRVEKDHTRNSTRGFDTARDTSITNRVAYTTGITGRDAQVAVQLYDLQKRTLVMTARLQGSSEAERPMVAPMPVGRAEVTVDMQSKVPPEEQGYPGAPELALALEQPFRDFARMLPGSPRAPSTPPLEKK
jgi:hypothetical protein